MNDEAPARGDRNSRLHFCRPLQGLRPFLLPDPTAYAVGYIIPPAYAGLAECSLRTAYCSFPSLPAQRRTGDGEGIEDALGGFECAGPVRAVRAVVVRRETRWGAHAVRPRAGRGQV